MTRWRRTALCAAPPARGHLLPHGAKERWFLAALQPWQLNLVTEPDRYPLPNMLDFADRLSRCTVFSKIDLRKGYWQVPVHDDDIAKTAVITPFGLRVPADGFRSTKYRCKFPADDGPGHLWAVLCLLLPGRPTCCQPLTRGTNHTSEDPVPAAPAVWFHQLGEVFLPRQRDD